MNLLLVADRPEAWRRRLPGVEIVGAWDYLTDPAYSKRRNAVVFNLCRSYAYQRVGYYVSLMAEARGHRPKPEITALREIRSRTHVRMVSEDLSGLIRKSLARIQSKEFDLSIYFGRPLAKRYDRLAQALAGQFQAPLLRARFVRGREWELRSVGPIAAEDIPDSHWESVQAFAHDYFARRRWTRRNKKQPRFWLAILVDPDETDRPSNAGALRRFAGAASRLDIGTEMIERKDYSRIGEFDALFIRVTTNVDHFSYRFASRAEVEGLVVIDTPRSIARCNNKVFLKEHLERFGVRTPRTMIVPRPSRNGSGGSARERVLEELGLPCILKQPDSSFSLGVLKAETPEELDRELARLFEGSELVIAQEWLPTEFDWRVGVLNGEPLYACRYFMARGHWQIMKHEKGAPTQYGNVETLPVEEAPKAVVRAALRAARPIGDGLYGIDVKQSGGKAYVIEVNDNPNVDAGSEDRVLGNELYDRVMRTFLERMEKRVAAGR